MIINMHVVLHLFVLGSAIVVGLHRSKGKMCTVWLLLTQSHIRVMHTWFSYVTYPVACKYINKTNHSGLVVFKPERLCYAGYVSCTPTVSALTFVFMISSRALRCKERFMCVLHIIHYWRYTHNSHVYTCIYIRVLQGNT
jgi:hypothetical protein